MCHASESLVSCFLWTIISLQIIQALRDNEHSSFTKFELFYDFQDSPWQNQIRLDIGMLTWDNQLQAERRTWANRFLNQDNHTRERLCFFALERAKKVDNDRFSKAPNMLFYLIKEIPGPPKWKKARHDPSQEESKSLPVEAYPLIWDTLCSIPATPQNHVSLISRALRSSCL